jgi:hypothetical protein
VPSRAQCKDCHDTVQPSRVLGFSAISLDWDNPNADELDLQALVDGNLITAPPTTTPTAGAYYPVPGDTTERAVLGYMHGNCGHCHNPTSKYYTDNGVLMQLRLTVGTLASVAATLPYTTSVGVDGTTSGIDGIKKIVAPGLPDQSQMVLRLESTNPALKMPALGTEMIDPAGQTLLRTWIMNLQ